VWWGRVLEGVCDSEEWDREYSGNLLVGRRDRRNVDCSCMYHSCTDDYQKAMHNTSLREVLRSTSLVKENALLCTIFVSSQCMQERLWLQQRAAGHA
jgi:hypothetical protein